ncbi:MAG: hypothetical protein WED15_01030 [Akkermansiaceae bacterium]
MPQETLKLPAHFALEPELRAQLSARAGKQRCLEGHDELLLIVHDVPEPAAPKIKPLLFWKRHDGRWTQPGGPGISELGDLLNRYSEIIGSHHEVVTRAENAADILAILRHAGPLSRSSQELAHALDQTLASEPNDREIREIRDRAREIDRAAELLHTDARITLEFIRTEHGQSLARSAELILKTAQRILLVAAVFLPLIALGIFIGLSGALPAFMQWVIWSVIAVSLLATAWLSRKSLQETLVARMEKRRLP